MREYLKPLLLCMGLLVLLSTSLFAANNKAILLDIDGAIGPATQDYIKRGLLTAQRNHASAVILQINTPGGLESATRNINEAIIASPVPVIAYVAPAGARAASAGTFIMYASHIAAMAPGTNIGAASPIDLASIETTRPARTAEKKMMSDATAYLQSLAELRDRNISFATQAVRNSASISADEAMRTKVINIVANNYPELLQKADGQKINLDGREAKVLTTKNMEIETITPDWRYRFLTFITNPNVAYLMMLLAIYGLFFELSNPGLVLPGVAGFISLLIVLYAFQLMPIDYVGLTLILVGIAFMIFEVFISSFGVLGIGGVIAFIIGSIMLFDTEDPHFMLALPLVLAMSILSSAFFLLVLNLAIRSHKRAIITGQEGLIGSHGTVLSVDNERLVVRVMGEIWDAKSTNTLKPGNKVRVTDVQGLVLTVEQA